MKRVLLRFQDPTDGEIYSEYLVKTAYSEETLQRLARRIARELEKQGIEDWSYDDIIEEMVKRGYLKVKEYEKYLILL